MRRWRVTCVKNGETIYAVISAAGRQQAMERGRRYCAMRRGSFRGLRIAREGDLIAVQAIG